MVDKPTILRLFRSIYEKQPGEAHPLSQRPFL